MEEPPRLVRSGLILFSSRIISVFTGLAFTIMITRSVSEVEYGVWSNINSDIIAYFTLLSGMFPFWIMRFVARGHKDSAKTGFVANSLLGIISTLIYVLLIPFILPLIGISLNYLPIYILASAQIIEIYILSTFQSILRVTKIEALSYGLLLHETTKVLLGYWLIIYLKTGLQGAVLTLIFAFLIQIIVFLYFGRRKIEGKINWTYIKEWTKGSTVNLYNVIGQRIVAFSLILLIVICGETIGLKARAYYGASFQIASVITNSTFLVFALYPRLLMLKKSEDITESFKLFFMFALPMTVGIIAFADSFLTILGKRVIAGELVDYSVATPILRLLAIYLFALSISQVLNTVVFGTEKFDLEARIPLKKLIHSKIFIVFTLTYVKALMILPALYFVLPFFSSDPILSAFYVAQLMLISEIILLIVRFLLARKMLTFTFPWRNILKYSFSSAIMALFLLLIKHPTKISTTALYSLIGGIIYLTVLLVIDKEARELLRATIAEVKAILKKTQNLKLK